LAQLIGGIAALISAFAMVFYYRKISKSVEEQVRARETDKFRVIVEKVLAPFIGNLEDDLTRFESERAFSSVNVLKSSADEFKNSYYLFKTECGDLAKRVEAYDEKCSKKINEFLGKLKERALSNKSFIEEVKMVIETYPSFDEWMKDRSFNNLFNIYLSPGKDQLERLIDRILWESGAQPSLGREIATLWDNNPQLFFKLIDKHGFRDDVDKLKASREELKQLAKDLKNKLEQKAQKLSSIYGFDIDEMRKGVW